MITTYQILFGDERLLYKLEFYDNFLDYVNDLKKAGNNLVICGDLNTAHKEIDLARPKQNEKVSGFLPIEREWVTKFLSNGYIDNFRMFNQEPKNYTWWSYRNLKIKKIKMKLKTNNKILALILSGLLGIVLFFIAWILWDGFKSNFSHFKYFFMSVLISFYFAYTFREFILIDEEKSRTTTYYDYGYFKIYGDKFGGKSVLKSKEKFLKYLGLVCFFIIFLILIHFYLNLNIFSDELLKLILALIAAILIFCFCSDMIRLHIIFMFIVFIGFIGVYFLYISFHLHYIFLILFVAIYIVIFRYVMRWILKKFYVNERYFYLKK